ncbi:TlpA family protein disulfide reductase [Thalassobaculum sp.]|uniref:TlpA family protein disulfide reductase n=1 Tax=Thalassobaculum sp. TaxID=2022740 RepID=UPI003B5909D5
MAFLGSLSSWSPRRLAVVGGVVGLVAALAVAGSLLTVASASSPPAFSGGYGSWEAFADPQPAPAIDFLDPDGERINLDAYKGQTLLVNFWATWCAPCIRELPALDELQADMGSEAFQVLIISIDRKGLEVAQPFLDNLEVEHLKTAADPKGALAREMKATGLPTTVIISPEGKVMGRLLGDAEWNSDGAKALVRYYLQ